jgi:hypothetical protein
MLFKINGNHWMWVCNKVKRTFHDQMYQTNRDATRDNWGGEALHH